MEVLDMLSSEVGRYRLVGGWWLVVVVVVVVFFFFVVY